MNLTPAQKRGLLFLPADGSWSWPLPGDLTDTLFLMCDLAAEGDDELVDVASHMRRMIFRLTPAGIEARKAMEGK